MSRYFLQAGGITDTFGQHEGWEKITGQATLVTDKVRAEVVVIKAAVVGVAGLSEPGVSEGAMDVDPLVRISLKELDDEVLGVVGDAVPDRADKIELSLLDQRDQLPDVRGIKRLITG